MSEIITSFFGPRVLVLRDRQAASQGGIVIPEQNRQNLDTGTIVYTGTNYYLLPDEPNMHMTHQLVLAAHNRDLLGSVFLQGQRILFLGHEAQPLAIPNDGIVPGENGNPPPAHIDVWIVHDDAILAVLQNNEPAAVDADASPAQQRERNGTDVLDVS